MSRKIITLKVPISYSTVSTTSKRGVFNATFPHFCIYCCERATNFRDIEIEREYSDTFGGAKTFKTTLKIPYCNNHLRKSERASSIIFTPLAVALIASFIAWIVIFIKDYVIGSEAIWEGLALLFFGLIGVLIVVYILTILLWKPILGLFNKHIKDTLWGISGGSLGFKATFIKSGDVLRINILNAKYVEKFMAVNTNAKMD